MSAKLTELPRISSVDTGDLIYIARTVGDTGVSAAVSRADFEDNLHVKLSLAQDTGKYHSDVSGKGDTGDVVLWSALGGIAEGPKLPQGAATGGTLADTGTAQVLSGKSISGGSIIDTGVHLVAHFAAGVGADTGTFLRGDGNWQRIQLARASDTGKYLADEGQFVIPSAATTAGIQAAIDSVASGSAVRVKLLGTAYDLSGGSVTNNGRIVSWDIDPRATFTGAGTLPSYTSPNYGSYSMKNGAQILMRRGDSSNPVTTGGSVAIFALDSAATSDAPSPLSVFVTKRTNADGANVRAFFAEAVDHSGWDGTGSQNFVEGARHHGILIDTGATLGSAYGTISFAGQAAAFDWSYLIGNESQTKNEWQDAPAPALFDEFNFSAAYLAGNNGSKKGDAAYVTNGFADFPYRTGLMVMESSIDHSIVWNKAALVHGIALLEGSFTGSAFAMRDTDRLGIYSDTGTTLVSSYAHGQIKFPATQSASADANTLDDYEEGTFTPAFSASGATFSYTTQTGYYTKIGNLVFVNAVVVLATSGNTLAAATLSMTGLPFAARATTPSAQKLNVQWTNSTTSYVNMNAQLPQGATSMTFQVLTAAATSFTANATADALLHATNGSNIRVFGVYVAD